MAYRQMKNDNERMIEEECYKNPSHVLGDLIIVLLNNKMIPENWVTTVTQHRIHGYKDLFIEGSDP